MVFVLTSTDAPEIPLLLHRVKFHVHSILERSLSRLGADIIPRLYHGTHIMHKDAHNASCTLAILCHITV